MKANEIEMIVKATMAAMNQRGGDVGFMESLQRFKLGEEKLEIWLTAYEENEISGIKALTETFSSGADFGQIGDAPDRGFFSNGLAVMGIQGLPAV